MDNLIASGKDVIMVDHFFMRRKNNPLVWKPEVRAHSPLLRIRVKG